MLWGKAIEMKLRNLTVLALPLLVACGDDSPTGQELEPTLRNVNFITLNEYEGYLTDVQSTIPGVTVMMAEFSAIGKDYYAGFVPVYWIGEYTKNLLRRVEGIQAQAQSIRPQHPELLKLHTEEYEAALEDFHVAFTLFVQGIERPGSVSTDDVNDWIVGGNTHLIRLQILLGDLGGRRIDFFASQGGGDGFGDIDF